MVFIDESGFGLEAHRSRGKAPIGVRAYELRHFTGPNRTSTGPHITIIVAFSPSEGIIHYQLRIGSTTASIYSEFIDTLLRHPHFKHSRYIIDDNAKIHSDSRVQEILEAHPVHHEYDHVPPYSPQLNPIEQVWNQMKTYAKEQIREAKEKNKQVQLGQWLEDGLKLITRENCISYMNEVYRVYTICLDKQPLK